MQKKFNAKGEELMDPTPMALPVGYQRPPTLQEQMVRVIRSERWKQIMEAQGAETFEESNDFDVGDDFDPTSPWEESFVGQFEKEAAMESQHFEADTGGGRRRKAKPNPPGGDAPSSGDQRKGSRGQLKEEARPAAKAEGGGASDE